MSCWQRCSRETGSYEHNKEMLQQLEKGPKTWVRRPYLSSPCAQVHNVQKCERCEALDLNEKGRASWQCRGAG